MGATEDNLSFGEKELKKERKKKCEGWRGGEGGLKGHQNKNLPTNEKGMYVYNYHESTENLQSLSLYKQICISMCFQSAQIRHWSQHSETNKILLFLLAINDPRRHPVSFWILHHDSAVCNKTKRKTDPWSWYLIRLRDFYTLHKISSALLWSTEHAICYKCASLQIPTNVFVNFGFIFFLALNSWLWICEKKPGRFSFLIFLISSSLSWSAAVGLRKRKQCSTPQKNSVLFYLIRVVWRFQRTPVKVTAASFSLVGRFRMTRVLLK